MQMYSIHRMPHTLKNVQFYVILPRNWKGGVEEENIFVIACLAMECFQNATPRSWQGVLPMKGSWGSDFFLHTYVCFLDFELYECSS